MTADLYGHLVQEAGVALASKVDDFLNSRRQRLSCSTASLQVAHAAIHHRSGCRHFGL
jgi:hypothetical protein